MAAGYDIWEMAVLPMLTNNAECWQDVSSNTIQELDKLQNMFLRCLFAVGSGCPIPALYWETGTIRMEYKILQKKLLFLHHVATLPDTALAKEIYIVQTELALPGLVKECNEFLVKFGITSIHNYSKGQWKHLVKTKIAELNKDNLLTQIRGRYKKLSVEKLKGESCKIKPYLSNHNLADARLRFKINSEMTPTVKMNFQSDIEYTREMWACPGCSSSGDVLGCRDTQRHIMVCPGYDSFRQDKDLSQDKDIVQYFQQVIKHRLDN